MPPSTPENRLQPRLDLLVSSTRVATLKLKIGDVELATASSLIPEDTHSDLLLLSLNEALTRVEWLMQHWPLQLSLEGGDDGL